LKKENHQLVSITTQLKLLASDGKKYLTDVMDYDGIILLGKEFPGKKANRFIKWFTYSDESIDGKSKTKAYALFESFFRPYRSRYHKRIAINSCLFVWGFV
jgi:cell filamentation protein